MTTSALILVIVLVIAVAASFVWLALNLRKVQLHVGAYNSRIDSVKKEVDRVFTEEFREELRNRGRMHFEKIINENAMFMQQDLHLTASQLNDYMRESLKKVLDEEFEKYTESIEDAKQTAIESINKTQVAMEEQRTVLQRELKEQIATEKKQLIARLDQNISSIVNHYLLEALGDEIDFNAQGEFIFQHLEDQKAAILEDIRSGA